MLLKNFFGTILGILFGLFLVTVLNDITVFLPNVWQHKLFITGLSGLLLFIFFDRNQLLHGICLGIMGVFIVDLLGGLTAPALLSGILATIGIYVSIGILTTITKRYS